MSRYSPVEGRTLLIRKGIFLSLCFVFVFLLFPQSGLAADLNSITSLTTSGVVIHQGDVVFKDTLTSVSPFWAVDFDWVNQVGNGKAYLFLIKGGFGSVSGGTLVDGVNVSIQTQSWAAGSNHILKSFSPSLGDPATDSGTYTYAVVEFGNGYTLQDFFTWFSSGGMNGIEPLNYSTLSFTYSAQTQPQELPGALSSVMIAGHPISDGEKVEQKAFASQNGVTDQLWSFNINWPTVVANNAAYFMVFRGTYGHVEGNTVNTGVNFAVTNQSFSSGTQQISKFIDLPALNATTTALGTYTIMVLERDPKTPVTLIPQEALWFASGGVDGTPPTKYSFLTFTTVKSATCCSSILFIPGLEGSRLYTQESGSENQLWEPALIGGNADVQKLYLDSTGKSINAVYTKSTGVIDQTNYPIGNFEPYKNFLQELSTLNAEHTIAGYTAFAYDWRMSLTDVVAKGTPYADGTHYIEDALTLLAASSITGKVTIVGHSNGGLVAKALMQKLEADGKSNLVDKIIFVGTPQLGTPQAVASILHGDFQELPGATIPGTNRTLSFILDKATARGLGVNMPDAYSLLPSNAYFGKILTPVIDLTNAPQLKASAGITKNLLNDAINFRKFVTEIGGRTKSTASDIETPAVLSSVQFDSAASSHTALDSWVPPSGVDTYQVVGFGLSTPSGVAYTEKSRKICLPLTQVCSDKTILQHEIMMVNDGDGVVVNPSKLDQASTTTYFLNLPALKQDTNKPSYHPTLTESEVFKNLFLNILGDKDGSISPLISTSSPSLTGKTLRLRVLSPVSIDAYDASGNHTGLVKNFLGSDLLLKEENIPNSYYQEFGEGKYIGLPDAGTYSINLKGFDEGTFTFEVSEVQGNQVIKTISYADVPVTASTTGTVSLSATNFDQLSLTLDADGDGKNDLFNATSTAIKDPATYLLLIKKEVQSMDLGVKTKRQLVIKLSNLERLVLKSGLWDDEDDDGKEPDLKKGEKMRDRILRKIDKIDTYIQKQLKTSQKNSKKDQYITASQAENLLNLTSNLKTLVQ